MSTWMKLGRLQNHPNNTNSMDKSLTWKGTFICTWLEGFLYSEWVWPLGKVLEKKFEFCSKCFVPFPPISICLVLRIYHVILSMSNYIYKEDFCRKALHKPQKTTSLMEICHALRSFAGYRESWLLFWTLESYLVLIGHI